jgi:hypothetical protein
MGMATVLIILGIPAAYGLLIVGATLLVFPFRRDLATLAEDILRESKWNADERKTVNFMLDTCMSFAIGLALPIGIIAATLDVLLRKPIELTRLDADGRFDGMLWRYFVSILAANPLAAFVTLPLMAVSFAIFVAYDGPSAPLRAVEEPLKRAGGVLSYNLT